MRPVATLALGLAIGSAPAHAHHSFAALFDPSKTVAIEGTVTDFEFIAPHAYIRIDVTHSDGTVAQWEIETTSPGQLIRAGLTPQTLASGDRIAVVGNPARDGRPLLRLLTVTMPDGENKRIQ